jgi:hypothetical protein
MLVTRIVPCNYCLTVFGEKETVKSWQDWSFLDVARSKRVEPPPRVSQVRTLRPFLYLAPGEKIVFFSG